jgi:hypothetical protein
MPKESIEIKSFHNGIMAAPDSMDIPLDAASYSENLEQIGEDGKLRGIPDDSFLNKIGTWANDTTGVYNVSFDPGGGGGGAG